MDVHDKSSSQNAPGNSMPAITLSWPKRSAKKVEGGGEVEDKVKTGRWPNISNKHAQSFVLRCMLGEHPASHSVSGAKCNPVVRPLQNCVRLFSGRNQ
jgi:hypothetical protein